MRNLGILIYLSIFMGVLSGCAPKSTPTPSPESVQSLPSPQATAPPSSTVPPQNNLKAVEEVGVMIGSILEEGKRDKCRPVADIITRLCELREAGKLYLTIIPEPHDKIAVFTQWDPVHKRTSMVWVGPTILQMAVGQTPAEFRDSILQRACHETLHALYTPMDKWAGTL